MPPSKLKSLRESTPKSMSRLQAFFPLTPALQYTRISPSIGKSSIATVRCGDTVSVKGNATISCSVCNLTSITHGDHPKKYDCNYHNRGMIRIQEGSTSEHFSMNLHTSF